MHMTPRFVSSSANAFVCDGPFNTAKAWSSVAALIASARAAVASVAVPVPCRISRLIFRP